MKYFRNILEILAGLCLSVVVVSTFLQVLFRFVLKIPAPWTEEITRIAFAYLVFLGTAVGFKRNAHLSVDIIQQFPSALRRTVILFGYVISIVFACAFTYFGWVHTMNSRLQTTPTLEIPLAYLYIIVPISGVCMIVFLCRALIGELRGPERGADEA